MFVAPGELHEYDELIRFYRERRAELAPKLTTPIAERLAVILAAMGEPKPTLMVTTVNEKAHAFIRLEYGTGEFVDVDAAGDEVGADPVRVEAAGVLFPDAMSIELTAVDPTLLLAAADAAKRSDYPKAAQRLIQAAQNHSRLLA
jgi:hypothetical protein